MNFNYRSLFGLKAAPVSGSESKSTGAGSSKSKGGGGQLPPPEEPKVKPKQTSFPGYATATAVSNSAIPKVDLSLANKEITSTYRFGATTSDTLRSLTQANPDLSGAVSTHLRMGIPERYTLYAYNPDGSFNVDATRLVMEIAARFDKMPGYDTGFTNVGSMRSVAEALALEMVIEGAMSMELVLDKARLPSAFAPVAVSKLKFYDDFSKGTKTLKPVQVVGGEEIDLDIPNFFMVWLDPSLLNAYPIPPLQSAIQPVLAASSFLDDMRKVCARHVYPRYVSSIDYDKLKPLIPMDVQQSPEELEAYLKQVTDNVRDTINGLGIEEALIQFGFIETKYIEGDAGDVPDTFETIKDIYNSKIATAARVAPTMIGHGSGTQSIASTDTLIAMKTSDSMIRVKLQEIFSKGFTLSCRLFGMDVTVSFEYDEIDLRPPTELEAFKAQRQSRYKEQLSMGVITNEEFSLRTTGRLPSANMPDLSGTMFMDPVQAAADSDEAAEGNSYSGTGVGGGQSGGGAATQKQKSKQPTGKRGGTGR